MKKIILFAGLLLLLTLSTFAATPVTSGKTNAQKIVEAIHNPKTDYVVVVSHRGDWRDYPENSIPAIESIIRMGVDVMELDLKLTADSVLVLCHDGTIDRTTTGKGRVSDVTYDYIKNCFLKTGHNCPTKYKMPTLKEALAVCKDRIVVNIDQGYQYYDLVMAITEELGVTEQILIKGKKPVDFVDAQAKKYKHAMMYMPIIDINKPSGQELFRQYMDKKIVPLAYEVCWQQETPEVRKCMKDILAQGSKIWVNTLWASLCGGEEAGIYDDYAFEHGAEVYQKVLDFGTSIIQTDRPELLISYLKKIGRHD